VDGTDMTRFFYQGIVMNLTNFDRFVSHKSLLTLNRILKKLPQSVQNNYKNKMSKKEITAAYNAISSYLPSSLETIPQSVQNNYKNKVRKGNYIGAYNTVTQYLTSSRRNNLANLSGKHGPHPIHSRLPYNAKGNRFPVNILTGNNAKAAINRAATGNARRIVEILQPYRSKFGGVGIQYALGQIRNNSNPVKYAMVNKNTKNLYAFGLLKNNVNYKNTRYLNIVGGYPRYGGLLLGKIKENAEKAKKNTLNLKAVVKKSSEIKGKNGKVKGIVALNNKGMRNDLVKLYEGFGFNTNGRYVSQALNTPSLQPMSLWLRPKIKVKENRAANRKRKEIERNAMITPRVTRSRA